MDLKALISAEHSKKQCLRVADYVGNNKVRFRKLLQIFSHGPYRITQRAAWPLGVCVERYPNLLDSHLPLLITMLKRADVHVAVRRNILRLLRFVAVPVRYHGEFVETCFKIFHDKKQPVAVHVFAMTFLDKITELYPELRKEMIAIIEERLPYGSAGFRSRAMKVLKNDRRLRMSSVSR